MSLNIRPPDPNQAKVFDIANPDRVGVTVEAGAEVSEVRFLDDGAVRNIANDHLRTVESTEVELDNPVPSAEPPVHAAVRQGQEAWQRRRSYSTWHDWKRVGAALVIGRAARLRQDILRQIEWCRGNLRDPELHAHIDDLIEEFACAVQTDTHNETLLRNSSHDE